MNPSGTVKPALDDLISVLSGLARAREDRGLIATAVEALDNQYALARKIEQEPGLGEIIKQLVGRIFRAYGTLAALKGRRILDIACGSSTSKAPPLIYVDTPVGEQQIPIAGGNAEAAGFAAIFINDNPIHPSLPGCLTRGNRVDLSTTPPMNSGFM